MGLPQVTRNAEDVAAAALNLIEECVTPQAYRHTDGATKSHYVDFFSRQKASSLVAEGAR